MPSEADGFEVICEPAAFAAVKAALAAANIPVRPAAIAQVPKTTVTVTDPDLAQRILRLMETLDDHDDVQNVYANFDIPDEVMNKVGA